jgi:hypothetical protein
MFSTSSDYSKANDFKCSRFSDYSKANDFKCSTFSDYTKAKECTLRDRHYACTEADGFALKRLR